jgi:ribonuclease BN (tRNA processing enzyme)
MKISEISKPLSLKNDGQLEIVFLGVGTAFGKKLYNNNILIIKGDTHILVDFGMNAHYGLLQNTGLEMVDIKTILPTHNHSDHIGGLELLTLTNRYIGQKVFGKAKLDMIISKEYQPELWNQSLRGGLAFNEVNEANQYLNFEDYYNVFNPTEIANGEHTRYLIEYNGIKLELFRTNHVPDTAKNLTEAFYSYGLFIEDRVLFSGDTKFDPTLLERFGDKSEIIFHDCSMRFNPVHASLEQLSRLESKYKSKMLLMHYSDDYEKYEIGDFMGLAREGVRYIFD